MATSRIGLLDPLALILRQVGAERKVFKLHTSTCLESTIMNNVEQVSCCLIGDDMWTCHRSNEAINSEIQLRF